MTAIVKTKLGPGIVKDENPVNGKVPVYLESGQKVLCKAENIQVIGYED